MRSVTRAPAQCMRRTATNPHAVSDAWRASMGRLAAPHRRSRAEGLLKPPSSMVFSSCGRFWNL